MRLCVYRRVSVHKRRDCMCARQRGFEACVRWHQTVILENVYISEWHARRRASGRDNRRGGKSVARTKYFARSINSLFRGRPSCSVNIFIHASSIDWILRYALEKSTSSCLLWNVKTTVCDGFKCWFDGLNSLKHDSTTGQRQEKK